MRTITILATFALLALAGCQSSTLPPVQYAPAGVTVTPYVPASP